MIGFLLASLETTILRPTHVYKDQGISVSEKNLGNLVSIFKGLKS